MLKELTGNKLKGEPWLIIWSNKEARRKAVDAIKRGALLR